MSGMQVPPNSVWSSMNYTPPRGSCNHKNGMISNKCPCLRFMLHPVKAATSFECDGCGHHASYHNLDNPSEDAILAKWSAQEAQTQAATTTTSARNNKRRRITSQPHNEQQAAITIADDSVDGAPNGQTRNNEKLHAFSSVFSSRSGSQR
ncbi:hypothetical protein D6C84_00511 [Aureobasidium pullulans]|uniref:Uncharacterized protein n=1 Tax=Aureobasidium pullulans TaxID=5580 RepID=A0A4S9YCI2_AURPU|nr:hypothetical protein D6C84_00511 [Aureobasidium pullulans]